MVRFSLNRAVPTMRGGPFSFGGLREPAVEQELAETKGQLIEQARCPLKSHSGSDSVGRQVAATVHFDLQGVHAGAGRAVALDDMPTGEGLVDTRPEAHRRDDLHRLCRDPRRRALPKTIANDYLGTSVGRRHRMTIQEEGAAILVKQAPELFLDGPVIGPMNLFEALFQLVLGNGLAPERTMARRSAGNDSKATSCTRAEGGKRSRSDHGGVDLIFRAIAVDGSARSARDDRSDALLNCARHKLVDKGIFQRVKGPTPSGGQRDQPVWIIAPGMGNRQENRNMSRRQMDVRR